MRVVSSFAKVRGTTDYLNFVELEYTYSEVGGRLDRVFKDTIIKFPLVLIDNTNNINKVAILARLWPQFERFEWVAYCDNFGQNTYVLRSRTEKVEVGSEIDYWRDCGRPVTESYIEM